MTYYKDWEIAQGIPARDAYEESLRRHWERQEAAELKQSADDVAYEVFVGKFRDRRFTEEHRAEGWLPAPRYRSRHHSFPKGTEFLYDRHDQLLAYRLPNTNKS